VNRLAIRVHGDKVIVENDAPGLNELAFMCLPQSLRIGGAVVSDVSWTKESGLAFYRFSAVGPLSFVCRF
jgi:hypothetical protein